MLNDVNCISYNKALVHFPWATFYCSVYICEFNLLTDPHCNISDDPDTQRQMWSIQFVKCNKPKYTSHYATLRSHVLWAIAVFISLNSIFSVTPVAAKWWARYPQANVYSFYRLEWITCISYITETLVMSFVPWAIHSWIQFSHWPLMS